MMLDVKTYFPDWLCTENVTTAQKAYNIYT